MHPDKIYMTIKGKILDEIRLHYLALPKNQTKEASYLGYSQRKPHGVEFWIQPGETYILRRNIIYQLQEEEAIEVLDETRGDGLDGTRFIVKINTKFDGLFKKHDKGVKIVRKLEMEGLWVQANFEGEEIHLFIGDKKDNEGRHVHLIVGKSGDIRVDQKDKSPGDLVRKVLAVTLKDDKEIKATLEFEQK